jgi:hypothetical protein
MINNSREKVFNLKKNILSYKLIKILLNNQKYRFLMMGCYNTIFNYIFGLIIFKIFVMNILSISLFYFFNIFHNFIIHKFFSFRKKELCFKEILRALIVYGLMYIFSTLFLLFLLHQGLTQIVAYHFNLLISMMIFYFLHSQFTFMVKF